MNEEKKKKVVNTIGNAAVTGLKVFGKILEGTSKVISASEKTRDVFGLNGKKKQ